SGRTTCARPRPMAFHRRPRMPVTGQECEELTACDGVGPVGAGVFRGWPPVLPTDPCDEEAATTPNRADLPRSLPHRGRPALAVDLEFWVPISAKALKRPACDCGVTRICSDPTRG